MNGCWCLIPFRRGGKKDEKRPIHHHHHHYHHHHPSMEHEKGFERNALRPILGSFPIFPTGPPCKEGTSRIPVGPTPPSPVRIIVPRGRLWWVIFSQCSFGFCFQKRMELWIVSKATFLGVTCQNHQQQVFRSKWTNPTSQLYSTVPPGSVTVRRHIMAHHNSLFTISGPLERSLWHGDHGAPERFDDGPDLAVADDVPSRSLQCQGIARVGPLVLRYPGTQHLPWVLEWKPISM